MSVAFRVDDGSYIPALEISRDISFPFSARGDNDSFEVKIRYEVNKENFTKIPLGTTKMFSLGLTYFVAQGDPTDVGSGLYQFDRTWSSIPNTRTEGETVAFQFRYIVLANSGFGEAFETVFDFVTTADVVYEYFNNTKPDTIIAPRFYFAGTVPDLCVIQDSEVGIYMGKMYYRKTYYANVKQLTPYYNGAPFPFPIT